MSDLSGMPGGALLGFMNMGPLEMAIVGIVAVLLFGSRLPDVARSLGKSFLEFKKGLRDVESEINNAIYSNPVSPPITSYNDVDRDEPVAPKFEPPPSEVQPSEPQPESVADHRD